MPVRRLQGIPGFAIDRVAAAAGSDPQVLRLENLDTDLDPPREAIEATRQAIGSDEDNSYLPFTGRAELRAAVASRLMAQTGVPYEPTQVVITCGATEGMLDALLALTDPGEEVVLTDPTYAGMIYRARLAGARTRLVPFVPEKDAWRLDLDALRDSISPRTRALFLMNPSMPSGAVLSSEEWSVIAELCLEHRLWLLYNAAMERILFDGRPLIHPAALPQMAERTIVVGSVSKEYRMIGWRVGWVAAPRAIVEDIARVHIYNAVTATGISQRGALTALRTPDRDLARCVAEWQRRRDTVCEQLRGYPMIPAAGGWSQLLEVAPLGLDSFTASRRLLERGQVAATPMRDWGEQNGDRFVRLVYSNEPCERLAELRERVERALGAGGGVPAVGRPHRPGRRADLRDIARSLDLEPHEWSMWRSGTMIQLGPAEIHGFVSGTLGPAPRRVLEVGCGTGYLTLELARAGHTATGLDPSDEALGVARETASEADAETQSRLRYIEAGLDDLDAPLASFDAVIFNLSLHHVPDLRLAVARTRRLLVPGGLVVVNEFAYDRLDEATAAWAFEAQALIAAGSPDGTASAESDPRQGIAGFRSAWMEKFAEHRLHGHQAMRSALLEGFEERHFAWGPYLFVRLANVLLPPQHRGPEPHVRLLRDLETLHVMRGSIQALGFRFVGAARPGAGRQA